MIQTVKLAKLVLSDINVRTRGEDLIEQFAADISARGILQNLVVTSVKKPRGSYGVIAGSRRFRALMLLAERGEEGAFRLERGVAARGLGGLRRGVAELGGQGLALPVLPARRSLARRLKVKVPFVWM